MFCICFVNFEEYPFGFRVINLSSLSYLLVFCEKDWIFFISWFLGCGGFVQIVSSCLVGEISLSGLLWGLVLDF